ncbi:MAG: T9SS type A sorting domain-containing protein [Chitinophagales bacterium]|nr:T9SS type A sorting domain-containing protein [Chitinophagales bacterium]
MLRFFFVLLLCHVAAFTMLAQINLVPNPSFEEYNQCPAEVGEFEKVDKWINMRATPDYFNRCATDFVSIPCNICGCQVAATGNAYIGLCGYNKIDSYREIVGVELITSLSIGQIYYVSFKASPGFGGQAYLNMFNNKLGIKFTSQQYNVNHPAPINNHAHVYTNAIISDTLLWTTVQGTFVADSAYTHIMIGNFFDNMNTDTIGDDVLTLGSYYYIDDVCVTTNPQGCTFPNYTASLSNDFLKVFPNPVDDVLYIEHPGMLPDISLYDLTGKRIETEISGNLMRSELNASKLTNGVYIVKVNTKAASSFKKIIVSH